MMRTFGLLFALGLLFAIAACGRGGETAARPTNEAPEWERLGHASSFGDGTDFFDRTRVPGGWIYRDHWATGSGAGTALCFVPDVAQVRS